MDEGIHWDFKTGNFYFNWRSFLKGDWLDLTKFYKSKLFVQTFCNKKGFPQNSKEITQNVNKRLQLTHSLFLYSHLFQSKINSFKMRYILFRINEWIALYIERIRTKRTLKRKYIQRITKKSNKVDTILVCIFSVNDLQTHMCI